MTTDRLTLDRLAADACPPLELVEVDGWRLRAAGGVLKRANSALPLSDALPVDAVVDFYRSRDLTPQVHVGDRAVDAALAECGWQRHTDVVVLTGPVPDGPSAAEVRPAPDEDWLEAYWAVDGRGDPAGLDVVRRSFARVHAASAYARVVEDGRTVAVARGVVADGHLGLFAMAVLPGARRRGLGREVLHALGTWGRAQGAQTAYLQVLEDNTAARGLYAAAGLAPAYRYHYRALV